MKELEILFQKYPTYYVGGYVRDLLRGVESSDVDIAIDAPLADWIYLFSPYKPYIMPRYESASFKHERKHYTISRMRRDISHDGRQSDIIPVHSIEEDAKRRDFTINAIYMTYDQQLIDPVGGVGDLKNTQVRFIGDPEQRIKEDQLRILRYFRFCALLNVAPQKEIIDICQKYIPITKVSKERILEEYNKLLKRHPSQEFLERVKVFYQ